jgi:hypothetical protein
LLSGFEASFFAFNAISTRKKPKFFLFFFSYTLVVATMYQSSQDAADASTSPNGTSNASKFEKMLVFLFSDVIVFAAKKKLAGVSTRNLVFRGRIFVHEMRLRNAPANSENRQCTLSYMRQTVDGLDSYTVVFKSPSDKEEWWMGLDDVINEAKREMCFPESDHQILTSRGFASLDDVLRHVRWSPAPGGKVLVADWRNLEVATFDAAAQRLVYRQPRRLVLNAAGADVVEFGTAAFGDDDDDAAAAAASDAGDVTSVVATRQHELYARIAPASRYEKLTCQQLLERMQAPGDAVQFLSAARNGVQAALPAAAGRKRAHVLATLEQLQIGVAASGAFLELYGAWLSAGAFDESGVAFVAADEQRRAYLEARLGAVGAAPAFIRSPLAWRRWFCVWASAPGTGCSSARRASAASPPGRSASWSATMCAMWCAACSTATASATPTARCCATTWCACCCTAASRRRLCGAAAGGCCALTMPTAPARRRR